MFSIFVAFPFDPAIFHEIDSVESVGVLVSLVRFSANLFKRLKKLLYILTSLKIVQHN